MTILTNSSCFERKFREWQVYNRTRKLVSKRTEKIIIQIQNILEDFEMHHHIFDVYAIEKLLAGFNVQPRIGMNQSLI